MFRRGAEFRNVDWAISAHGKVWPEGSKWLWEGRGEPHKVLVVGRGKVPIRDDGAILETTTTRYEWA
jgi:hypothetical protein